MTLWYISGGEDLAHTYGNTTFMHAFGDASVCVGRGPVLREVIELCWA